MLFTKSKKAEKFKMRRVKENCLSKQHGVGLIEVLITLFILAVGLLGVAALQFTGSFANKDAISRTQAEMVAAQVVERLRSAARMATVGDGMVVNNNYFNPNIYDFTGLSCDGSNPYQCYCLTRPESIPNCEGNVCTESQMSTYDGWALACAAVQTNPNTAINVSCVDKDATDTYTCSPGSAIEVLLTWPVSSSGNLKYTLNARCNDEDDDVNACVFKDITL